jgi:hypothetical protein
MSIFRQNPRVDWFRIINDLIRLPVTPPAVALNVSSIADAIDVPRTTVIGWCNLDAEPRFSDGEALLAFWISKTGKTAECVPMIGKVNIRSPQIVGNPTA